MRRSGRGRGDRSGRGGARPAPVPRPAEELGPTLTIDRLIPGGEGMARAADGRSVFVPGALPGDVVQPQTAVFRKSWARLQRWSLVEGSADRRPPPCPAADRCSGCDWLALPESNQRAWKTRLVEDAFRRTGGLTDPVVEPPEAVAPLGYRSRLRLHIDEDGRVGLFARGSRRVVQLDRCPVSTSEVERGLALLAQASRFAARGLSAFDEVELRSSTRAPELVMVFRPRRRGRLPDPARAVLRRLEEEAAIALHGDQNPRQVRRLPDGSQLPAGPSTFTQVHESAALLLLDAVLEAAGPPSGRLLELYAGAGFFTLPLLRRGWDVVAVEGAEPAVRDGRAGVERAELPDPFVIGEAAAQVRGLADAGARFETVLLDPPRSGAAPVVAVLPALSPERVLMVSCDPVTAARDTRSLGEAGWTVRRLRTFDLFPQTHHVEVLVELGR